MRSNTTSTPAAEVTNDREVMAPEAGWTTHRGRHPISEREGLSTEGGWLIEWDGGFDTADSEEEAWKKVEAMIVRWGDADRDEFTVRPNVEDD